MTFTNPITSERQPARNEAVTVGATSLEIAPNRLRKVIILRNTSSSATAVITVNLGSWAAIANQGIVLRQYESFVDADDGGYQSWQGGITAISNEAGSTLSVMER